MRIHICPSRFPSKLFTDRHGHGRSNLPLPHIPSFRGHSHYRLSTRASHTLNHGTHISPYALSAGSAFPSRTIPHLPGNIKNSPPLAKTAVFARPNAVIVITTPVMVLTKHGPYPIERGLPASSPWDVWDCLFGVRRVDEWFCSHGRPRWGLVFGAHACRMLRARCLWHARSGCHHVA